MSIVVSRKTLSRQDEETIVSMLTIKPVEKTTSGRKPIYQQEQPPFPFYFSNKEVVHLPYAFGSIFLKSYPNDTREYLPIKVTFQGELRPRQKKKVAKLDAHFADFRTATFCAHTGFGKTRVANHYISKFGLLTVVLVPGTQLMEQWPKAVTEILPTARVGVAGEDCLEQIGDNIDVIICMPDRWQKIPDDIRKKVGFLIVDEAHMFCTPTRSVSLLQFEPKYILALTASPRRRDGTMGVIHSLCGLHQVKARYKEPVTVWRFLTGLEFKTEKNVKGETNWAGTLKSIVENEDYNELIADLVTYLVVDLKRKPLLMCERKYHVDDLTKRVKARKFSCDYLMENKNSYNDSQVILAIMKKAGTGFDEQYACPDFSGSRIDTVVYCSSFKEINGLIQYGGRAFRAPEPLIIHLVVKNGIIESQWRQASKYYKSKEYLANVEIKTISPDDIWGRDGSH
jgi:superfamily II DNA or RNA helicase